MGGATTKPRIDSDVTHSRRTASETFIATSERPSVSSGKTTGAPRSATAAQNSIKNFFSSVFLVFVGSCWKCGGQLAAVRRCITRLARSDCVVSVFLPPDSMSSPPPPPPPPTITPSSLEVVAVFTETNIDFRSAKMPLPLPSCCFSAPPAVSLASSSAICRAKSEISSFSICRVSATASQPVCRSTQATADPQDGMCRTISSAADHPALATPPCTRSSRRWPREREHMPSSQSATLGSETAPPPSKPATNISLPRPSPIATLAHDTAARVAALSSDITAAHNPASIAIATAAIFPDSVKSGLPRSARQTAS